jgi:hypothetical protein
MRRQTAGAAVVAAITLSALAHAQQGGSVTARADNGRWTTVERAATPADVPPASALFGIVVSNGPEGRSAIVTATPSKGSPLQIGDRIDEVQLPGVVARQRQTNPGYWSYQVWTPADFYRLAMHCLDGCLVRLRTAESTPWPRVFAYLPVGDPAFTPARDETSQRILAYVDARTGERFGPPASAVFGR